jgi:hypothetical protein
MIDGASQSFANFRDTGYLFGPSQRFSFKQETGSLVCPPSSTKAKVITVLKITAASTKQ